MRNTWTRLVGLLVLLVPILAACGQAQPTTPTTAPAATAAATTPVATAAATTPAATAAATTPAATAAATTESPVPTKAAQTEPSTKTLKVGLVTDLGKVNDGTFNEFAHKGADRAAKELGLNYKYIETIAQADYESNIKTFINEKFDVIVTVGFLIADATLADARANPDITFIGIDQTYTLTGTETVPANLVSIQFREDQAGFLAGALAAMMSKSGTVGIVAGMEIPPVKRFKNGFDNGAKYVRPDVNLLGTYVPTFTDPAQGASTAEQMIGDGADVVFGAGGPTGTGAIKAAAGKGAYVIGVDQDEFFTTFGNGSTPGADKLLSSAQKRVDVGVYDQIKAVVEGTFKGGYVLYEAKNNGIGLADFHLAASAVPDAVKQRLTTILAKLADGSLTTGVTAGSGDVDAATTPKADPFKP